MKNIISLIFPLMAIVTGASAQNGSFAWYGSDGKAKVETGLGTGNGTEGLWYVNSDDSDGGESEVVWDVQTPDGKPDDNLVRRCGGISGTAVLSRGTLTYNPFVDICFDVAGDKFGEPMAADASEWGGIAIAYQSDVAPVIELGLGELVDMAIGYARPRYTLPESTDGINFVRIPWSSFKQPASYTEPTKINGLEAAKQLVTIRFKVQAPMNSYHFKIIAIGSYNMAKPGGTGDNINRTKISLVEGKSTYMQTNHMIGDLLTKPDIRVTTGAPAYFSIDPNNGWWQKKVEGQWLNVKSGNFSRGTWRFKCLVKIDSSTDPNNQYVLSEDVKVKVNGTTWTVSNYSASDNDSYIAVSSPEFTLENSFAWYGSNGKAKVETGLGTGNGTEGLWYVNSDDSDGGESEVVWDVQTPDGKPDDNLVRRCGGISGTAVLSRGTLTYNPFVDICFDVAGDKFGEPMAADASEWGGIAIAYQSDVAPVIELGLGELDMVIGYARPRYTLPESTEGINFVRIPWSSFKQPASYTEPTKINGPDAAKQLVTIRFKVQAPMNSYHFKITAIGAYNMAEPQNQDGDNRTQIALVEGTSSDLTTIPTIGELLKRPTITVTRGEPAYFEVSNGCWQKKVNEKWEDYSGYSFNEGSWRFKCQVRVDNSTDPNNQYKLAKDVTVTVDGTAWENEAVVIGSTYSYATVYSPEVELEDLDEDTRTKITLVEGLSTDLMDIPKKGTPVTKKPNISLMAGAPAYFDVSNGCWQKKVGREWQDVQDGEFEAGSWRFKCPIRIDSSTDPDNQYVLSDDLLVKLNGDLCGRNSVTVKATSSFVYVNCPSIEVEEMNGFAWYGSDGRAKIETGLGSGSGEEGIWYVRNDDAFGGMSYVEWDCEETVGDYPDDALVQQCGGISGTAVLNNFGDENYDPFVDICFNVAGEAEVADASEWGGIAVAYTCDVAPIIELGLGDDVDMNMEYARPQVKLQPSPSFVTFVRIPWKDFVQPDWYMGENQMSGLEAAQVLSNVRFKVQGATDNSYHFNIIAVGSFNMPNDGSLPEPGTEKCATPTISYSGGKLKFACETEGVQFNYNIKDNDIKSGTGEEVDLSVTYTIMVYAAKDGYDNSDIATATLCWIDQQPATEGIVGEDAVTEVKAMPVLIQSQGGLITIQGAAEGTPIAIYGIDGIKYGTAVAERGVVSIATSLHPGSVAVVRIGEKAVKVLMK